MIFLARDMEKNVMGLIFVLYFCLWLDLLGSDGMVVEFKATYAISAYQHLSSEFNSHSWQCVLDPTLCDRVCQ
jgi:hypothetical protein